MENGYDSEGDPGQPSPDQDQITQLCVPTDRLLVGRVGSCQAILAEKILHQHHVTRVDNEQV